MDRAGAQEMACEVLAEGRPLVFYDSVPPGVHLLAPGFEAYRGILTELAQERDRVTASLRKALAIGAAMTNHSRGPIEVGEVFLYPQSTVEWGVPNVLACLVTGLFPPSVSVSLHLDGARLGSHLNSSKAFFGEDWRFWALWYARILPRPGHLYSCAVRHNMSQEDSVVYWEPETTDVWEESVQDSAQLAVLACGLLVGILGVIAGIILCVWKPVVVSWRELTCISSCRHRSDSG
ncbi:RLA class II histocompatibility antigen, DP alpha-1 chain-like [Chiloscyllium plagiosum]|uniref:RLA class II histocompatibility antigen, DP alpha-1 chain-like n=1 Tax=Chiloscyllium plagiosum TaxID=36176 RepID=UPI001CB87ACB|nr:RLA class II histocompatibility antigen, DP alpha-1 chain-like [Chiloscyllium plagiosum]